MFLSTQSLFFLKFKAAGFHLLVTLLIALCSGVLVFQIWFPGKLSSMLGGVELYQLVLIVEICLGPLMSLVIFNPKKPRSELIRDYSIIGVIQVAALVYGVSTVADSRPVVLAFVKDRIEVVSAFELDDDDLKAASDDKYAQKSWFGPLDVCTESPADPQEKSDLIFSAIDGKDIQMFPKYYRECKNKELIERSFDKGLLLSETVQANNPPEVFEELPKEDFVWLPVTHRFGAWVVVFPNKDINKAQYFPIEPWGSAN